MRLASGDEHAALQNDVRQAVNPMYLIKQPDVDCASQGGLCQRTGDGHISLIATVSLAASLKARPKDVNAWLYWEADRCGDDDPEGLIAWIGRFTGYS